MTRTLDYDTYRRLEDAARYAITDFGYLQPLSCDNDKGAYTVNAYSVIDRFLGTYHFQWTHGTSWIVNKQDA